MYEIFKKKTDFDKLYSYLLEFSVLIRENELSHIKNKIINIINSTSNSNNYITIHEQMNINTQQQDLQNNDNNTIINSPKLLQDIINESNNIYEININSYTMTKLKNDTIINELEELLKKSYYLKYKRYISKIHTYNGFTTTLRQVLNYKKILFIKEKCYSKSKYYCKYYIVV